MEVGVGLRGASLEQDGRWGDKEKKLLRTLKFPPQFDQKVDMRKVELEVMKPWITKTVTTLLGFEDEVVIEYVIGLLEDDKSPIIDPKKMQVSLTGFLETKTPEFMQELWRLLLSAQASPLKVPPEFIEQKKIEMRERQAKEERAIARRQEEAAHDQEIEALRQRERRDRRDQRGDDTRRRPGDRWDQRAHLNGRADRDHDDRGPPRDRPRRRFDSPPPRRSISPEPITRRDEPRRLSRSPSFTRSPVPRSSPHLHSHVSPSPPPPRRRRRSPSTPPRARRRHYSRSPEPPHRQRRYSRSPSPPPRRRRRSSSPPPAARRRRRSPSPRSPPPRQREYDDSPPRRRDRSPSPTRRRRRSSSTPPPPPPPPDRERSRTPLAASNGRSGISDRSREPSTSNIGDLEAELRAKVLRNRVEASLSKR